MSTEVQRKLEFPVKKSTRLRSKEVGSQQSHDNVANPTPPRKRTKDRKLLSK